MHTVRRTHAHRTVCVRTAFDGRRIKVVLEVVKELLHASLAIIYKNVTIARRGNDINRGVDYRKFILLMDIENKFYIQLITFRCFVGCD